MAADYQSQLIKALEEALPEVRKFVRVEYYKVGLLHQSRPYFTKEAYQLEKESTNGQVNEVLLGGCSLILAAGGA